MKKYRIIAGASAAVLVLGLMTACGAKQEEVVEKEPVIPEDALEEVTPEVVPEEDLVVEFPLEDGETENDEDPEAPVEDPEAELPAESRTILVAELTEIAEDGSMTILPYAPVDEELSIEDYANVDFSAFAAGEESETLTLSDGVLFQVALDGELTDADESALTLGSMLVIVTDDDGSQTIVIYNPVAE